MVTGPDAARLLDRIVTRDVAKMKVGQVGYTPWCDTAGKVIDDGTISRLGEHVFRMTSADPNLLWLTENAIGLDVKIEKKGFETVSKRVYSKVPQDSMSVTLKRSLWLKK